MLLAAEIHLQYQKKTANICGELCSNSEQPCIAKKCCRECEDMVRHWHN